MLNVGTNMFLEKTKKEFYLGLWGFKSICQHLAHRLLSLGKRLQNDYSKCTFARRNFFETNIQIRLACSHNHGEKKEEQS